MNFQNRTFLEFRVDFLVWEKTHLRPMIGLQSDFIINLHEIRVLVLLEFLIVSNSVFLYNSDAGRNGRSGTGWNVSNYLRKNWINFRNKPPHSKWFKFRVFNHFTTISRNSRKKLLIPKNFLSYLRNKITWVMYFLRIRNVETRECFNIDAFLAKEKNKAEM